MPIYEFYCPDCHTLFNFLSRRINPDRRPDCPRCGRRQLARQVSLFAISRGRAEEPAGEAPDLDEAKMEQAMAALAGEMEGVDENDPRQMGRLLRRLTELSGVNCHGGMEEAIRRLEAGEDPEKIEEEMGEVFGETIAGEGIKGLRRRYTPPAHDETLYTL